MHTVLRLPKRKSYPIPVTRTRRDGEAAASRRAGSVPSARAVSERSIAARSGGRTAGVRKATGFNRGQDLQPRLPSISVGAYSRSFQPTQRALIRPCWG